MFIYNIKLQERSHVGVYHKKCEINVLGYILRCLRRASYSIVVVFDLQGVQVEGTSDSMDDETGSSSSGLSEVEREEITVLLQQMKNFQTFDSGSTPKEETVNHIEPNA